MPVLRPQVLNGCFHTGIFSKMDHKNIFKKLIFEATFHSPHRNVL